MRIPRILKDERAQTSLEYALIIGLGVAMAGILAYIVKSIVREAPRDVISEGSEGIREGLQ